MLRNLRPHLNRFTAFLVRDFYDQASYRFSFLFSFVGVFIRALIFFFLSELIGVGAAPYLQDYNGDYFSFVIIGIALGGYFSVGLTGFSQALRQAQITGTLEATMMTPTPVSLVVIGSAAWSYTFTTFRVFLYLLIGAVLLTLDLSQANILASLLILILSIISFAAIGIIAAGIIMVIKRGDPITGLLANGANLLGGVYYPVAILPAGLQFLSYFLPLTYALHGLRLAMLNGASWTELAPDILALSAFCIVLFPLSLLIFRHAVDRARTEGTLAHY
ncbi:MAG: ABC transporter permease [Chloroflexi bacterium]|nr:ABC transporter permease [Chloroflexota bacterium]